MRRVRPVPVKCVRREVEIDRRRWNKALIGATALLGAWPALAAPPATADSANVLRVLFPAAESGFDGGPQLVLRHSRPAVEHERHGDGVCQLADSIDTDGGGEVAGDEMHASD